MPETVGKIAYDLLENPDKKQSVVETQQSMQTGYMDEIQTAAERAINESQYPDQDEFYVIAMRKRERHMVNVVRMFYYTRATRPTPAWDIDVWKVDQKKGDLFYCYSLPDIKTGHMMLESPQDFLPEDSDLVSFVHQFANETLE